MMKKNRRSFVIPVFHLKISFRYESIKVFSLFMGLLYNFPWRIFGYKKSPNLIFIN